MTKISIALCTYNGARFLRQQLSSFLVQTRLPDELVIGDDHSTDETQLIIREFARAAPFPVRLTVNEKNLGSTKNFEETIKRCCGDLIFLSDQDDVWAERKIEVIEAEFVKSEGVGLVFTNAELVSEDLKSLNGELWDFTFTASEREMADGNAFYKTLLKRNVVTGATAAFRSKFIEDFSPIPTHFPNMIHDGWVSLVISARSQIVYLNELLIKYRQHPGQQLGINWDVETRAAQIGGSIRERFGRSIGYMREQEALLERLIDASKTHPALRFEGKIESVLKSSAAEICENILHLENRISLMDKNVGRFPIILKELRSGRYHRFSRGMLSSIKDVFAH